MSEVILFILVVGIGSCVFLDIWGAIIAKCTGGDLADWGLPGRWIIGLTKGQWVIQDKETPPTIGEKSVGWLFHYAVSLIYAVLLVIFWGTGYILHPTFTPAFLIGAVLTTVAGGLTFMPGLGNGIMCRLIPGREAILNRMVVSHVLYAIALYVLALIVASSL